MSDGFKGINFKKVVVSQGDTAPARMTLNLAPEAVAQLIEKLTELAGAERGVKLTINSKVKEGKFGQFISSYTFVDEIQAPGANYGGGGYQQQQKPQGTFKPKAKPGVQSDATKAAVRRTLNTQVE